MDTPTATAPHAFRPAWLAGEFPAAATSFSAALTDSVTDEEFAAMRAAYRDSGGLARGPEILAVFEPHAADPGRQLRRWIAARDVLCFEWRTHSWFPWFQFDRASLAPQVRLRRIYAELAPLYERGEVAAWFARPNAWLSDCTPVSLLDRDTEAVVDAARAERFLITG